MVIWVTSSFKEASECDGLWLRCERSGLAEGAAKTAATRREQDADGKGPAAAQPEACNERRVLKLIEARAELLRDGLFAVAGEDMVEIFLDRRSKRTIVASPQLLDTGASRLVGHGQDVVCLFEVQGEADGVPAFVELRRKFRLSGIFQDGQVREVLPQEAETERDLAGHAEAPAKDARSVLTKVIVQASVAAAGG
jgi:hypothetical protein